MIQEGTNPQTVRINGVRHVAIDVKRTREGTVLRARCGLTADNVTDDLVSDAFSECPGCCLVEGLTS